MLSIKKYQYKINKHYFALFMNCKSGIGDRHQTLFIYCMSRSRWYVICFENNRSWTSNLLNSVSLVPEATSFMWIAISSLFSLKALTTSSNADIPPKDFLLIIVILNFLSLIEWLELDKNTVLSLTIEVIQFKGVSFEAPSPQKGLGPLRIPSKEVST